ncbi:putative ABC transporter [Megalodesulfovibrio gigas DSM 1382 = ATCC 19364]|uniref:Putative ABC transporter n=1 Tax=Megalodesulfovibrio gigas (strain ATCC 19364 / DSM 1382 / NCIMB 9332 / VKM B-1759) TaxID=1121448 RepID=T2GEG2_MEGG1|nr:putative ABC transporter [Megalodesulfovibrio gigas DSM 1382 = ATCC 19364]
MDSRMPASLPLLRLDHASVLRGGSLVLQDLCWELRPGQHWLLVGENGAGKSTFLQLVRGELWPLDRHARLYGLDGVLDPSPIGLRTRMGLVSPALQERYQRQGWHIRGREIAASGFDDAFLCNRTLTAAEAARLDETLTLCGAADLAQRPLSSFSQGELRLLLLVRALAPLVQRPALLLLDEGLEGLDTPARRRITAVLEALMARADGLGLILAAHRLDELPCGLTHVLRLDGGRLVDQSTLDAFSPDHATPWTDPPAAAPCPILHRAGTHRAMVPHAPGREPLLDIAHADVFVDRAHVLHDVSWTIPHPRLPADGGPSCDHWVVLGPNGAGKSTLMRLIQGELPPALGGSIRMAEVPTVLERRQAAPLVSPALQATYTYDDTAADVVAAGFFGAIGLWETPTSAQRRMAMHWLEHLGLADLAQRRLSTLSTGQARRVFLARALAPCPPLLLLDEPCAGLDPAARRLFLETLTRAASAGPCLILVTHHPEDCLPVFGNVLVLRQGRVQYAGPREHCPQALLDALLHTGEA